MKRSGWSRSRSISFSIGFREEGYLRSWITTTRWGKIWSFNSRSYMDPPTIPQTKTPTGTIRMRSCPHGQPVTRIWRMLQVWRRRLPKCHHRWSWDRNLDGSAEVPRLTASAMLAGCLLKDLMWWQVCSINRVLSLQNAVKHYRSPSPNWLAWILGLRCRGSAATMKWFSSVNLSRLFIHFLYFPH